MKKFILLTSMCAITLSSIAQLKHEKNASILPSHSPSLLTKKKLNSAQSNMPTQNKKTRVLDRRLVASAGDYGFEGTFSIDSTTYVNGGTKASRVSLYLEKPYNFMQPLFFEYEEVDQSDSSISQFDYGTVQSALLLKNTSKTLCTYNSTNQKIDEVQYSWNGTIWEENAKTEFTYNANGYTTEEKLSYWNGSFWGIDSRIVYTYDANNNILSIIEDSYNTGTWANMNKQFYTYNASNRMTLDSSLRNFDAGTNDYSSKYVEQISYNANLFTSLSKSWKSWLNAYRDEQKFEGILSGNKFVSGEAYEFDTVGGAFNTSPTIVDSAFYDGNNNIIRFYLLDPNTGYYEEYKTTRNAQNLVSKVDRDEEGVLYKNEFTYDTYNNLTKDENFFYDDLNQVWLNIQNRRFYYESFENGIPQSIQDIKAFSKVSLFPNPAQINSYISFTSSVSTETFVNVTDLTGRIIFSTIEKTNIGDHMIKLPVETWSNGFYFVNLFAANRLQESLKLIKE